MILIWHVFIETQLAFKATVSSKLLEEDMHFRFSQHLHTNNIPVPEQTYQLKMLPSD
jgi:hypothetical protein